MPLEKQNKTKVSHESIYLQILGALMWHTGRKEGFRVAVVELCPMAPRDALEGQAKQVRPLQPREVLLLCFIRQVLNRVRFEKEISLL